jgi:hypothetical protein
LSVSRTFKFGEVSAKPAAASSGRAAGASGAAKGAPVEKRYSMTFSLRAVNLFNRTNLSAPVGDLSSPFFGQSTATAGSFGFNNNVPSVGNRRVEAQVRFSF